LGGSPENLRDDFTATAATGSDASYETIPSRRDSFRRLHDDVSYAAELLSSTSRMAFASTLILMGLAMIRPMLKTLIFSRSSLV